MPIDYNQYPDNWNELRERALERFGNKCGWCGVPNYSFIYRIENKWHYMPEGHFADEVARYYKPVKIILTVAHIDHDITHNEDKNLIPLCQKCHLNHDIKQHTNSRKYGKNYKRDQLKLF